MLCIDCAISRSTYQVHFIDARDNCPNQKMLEADCVDDIYDYMHKQGHYVLKIIEVE